MTIVVAPLPCWTIGLWTSSGQHSSRLKLVSDRPWTHWLSWCLGTIQFLSIPSIIIPSPFTSLRGGVTLSLSACLHDNIVGCFLWHENFVTFYNALIENVAATASSLTGDDDSYSLDGRGRKEALLSFTWNAIHPLVTFYFSRDNFIKSLSTQFPCIFEHIKMQVNTFH